ncbi:MAG: hypothetical protein OEM62_06585 [Acidobacteriota bacterium]|nr:hypothetical protein [Acidobacteriota bacterium]
MVTLSMLWLPIVVSALVVFFASFLVWAVLPIHKKDWGRISDEDAVVAALRKSGISRGQYVFPFAEPSEFKNPEVKQKLEEGPLGMLVVGHNGVPNMAKSMVQSFAHNLVIGVLVAYLAAHSLSAGAHYLAVFRIVGTAAILGYAGANAMYAIWFHRTWSSIAKETLDGVMYGLLTAGVFGWLWPPS